MTRSPFRWALVWSVLCSPLTLLTIIAVLSTWPAVFSNNPLRLVLILLIVFVPAIPLLLNRRGSLLVNVVGAIALSTQVLIFGSLNYWFT